MKHRIRDNGSPVMDAIKTHKDLVVWQKALAMASAIYAATRSLPAEERLGLGRQLRRTAVSIVANIAEGSARRTTAEFLQSLHAARSSLARLETVASIAIDQGYWRDASTLIAQIDEVGMLLSALIRSRALARQTAHARACVAHCAPPANAAPAITTRRPPPTTPSQSTSPYTEAPSKPCGRTKAG